MRGLIQARHQCLVLHNHAFDNGLCVVLEWFRKSRRALRRLTERCDRGFPSDAFIMRVQVDDALSVLCLHAPWRMVVEVLEVVAERQQAPSGLLRFPSRACDQIKQPFPLTPVIRKNLVHMSSCKLKVLISQIPICGRACGHGIAYDVALKRLPPLPDGFAKAEDDGNKIRVEFTVFVG